jgi:hypothetical protein
MQDFKVHKFYKGNVGYEYASSEKAHCLFLRTGNRGARMQALDVEAVTPANRAEEQA